MGTKERREREKTEQRQKILNAALQIITSDGFAALTMRKLADRIEYSPAAIYLYFRNRDDIARELSEAGYQQLYELLSAAEQGKEPVERLYAVAKAYVAFGIEHSEMYRLVFMGDAASVKAAFAKADAESAATKSYALLLNLAQDLKKTSPYPTRVKTNEIVEVFWGTWHGIVSLQLTCAAFQSGSPQALAKLATEMLAAGLLDQGQAKGKAKKAISRKAK